MASPAVSRPKRAHIPSKLMRESLLDKQVMASTDSDTEVSILPDVNILVLGGQYTDYALLLNQRLTPLVYRAEMIDALAAAARARGVIAEAHLKLDSGMGRIGALPHELRRQAG